MAKFKINKSLKAKSISYGGKRSKKDIRYIVIHYTGGTKDTAKNEATFFKYSNARQAGAHFFVDRKGEIYKSIDMNRTAWSVGGHFPYQKGGGSYYKKCTNSNSVSIELCAIAKELPTKIQTEATKWLIHNYIMKYCPNAKVIIRHFDVNNKECPATMLSSKTWKSFMKKID